MLTYHQALLICVLVRHQARGYGDLATRSLLHALSSPTPLSSSTPRMFALTDYDPDGVAIMSIFKHGSRTLAHETTQLSCPSLRWLGLKSLDLPNRISGTGHSEVVESTDGKEHGLLKLSTRDRKKAIKMLEDGTILGETGIEAEWRRELQVMLMCGYKAEMEILDEKATGGLTQWVEKRLVREMMK